MKEIRLRPEERTLFKEVWMAAYKNARTMVKVRDVPVGSLIVIYEENNEVVSEPQEHYVPLLIVGKTQTYARATVIAGEFFDVIHSEYNGCTLSLNLMCAVLR